MCLRYPPCLGIERLSKIVIVVQIALHQIIIETTDIRCATAAVVFTRSFDELAEKDIEIFPVAPPMFKLIQQKESP